jgi:two-component system, cell cycle sensor histidine kinase and response regulator CckA
MGKGASSEEAGDAQFALWEHVPLPAYVYEVTEDDFVLRFINAAARAAMPYVTRFLGKPMGGLYRDQPDIEAAARRALRDGVALTRDVVLRRHDQTEAVTPVRLTWVPLPPNHLGVFTQGSPNQDGTDAALRESEARYRGLFASLPDAVLLRSTDGRVLACNDAAARLWGAADSSDLVGRHDVLGGHFEVKDEAGVRVSETDLPGLVAIRSGKPAGPFTYEVTLGHTVRWLRAVAQPIFGKGTEVSASVTVLTDISERVLAERELRAAATRLDLALDAGRMGVWEYDATRNVGWWSDNLNGIFCLHRALPEGIESFSSRVHPDDLAVFLGSVSELTRQTGEHGFELELRIIGDDGVARSARIHGRRTAEPLRAVGTITDVTERRRMEDELRRAHRLESIGRLAGGVAHDFNNLLAAMLGAVDLLEGEVPHGVREEVATIRHAAIRARDLTKQLLAFAKKQPIEFRTVRLDELVTTVERMLRRLVGPSIAIELVVEEQVTVRADPSSFEQVLVNLVVNAKEAMPAGGRLLVRVGKSSGSHRGPATEAVLEVTDSGTGMDEETCRRVFDPFFTTKEHGTGLGMASSYGIVQQHGGDIVVESEVGRGTTFRVYLPAVEAQRESPAPQAEGPSKKPLQGCVLVVDDEELVRNMAVRVLRRLGFHVLSAGTAAEAIEVAAAHVGLIDIMLCDVAMPVRDGPSLAAELLQLRPELRVVLASGYSETVIPKGLPRTTFLAKPYTHEELAGKLEEARRLK